jgi:isochorismate hydrolase
MHFFLTKRHCFFVSSLANQETNKNNEAVDEMPKGASTSPTTKTKIISRTSKIVFRPRSSALLIIDMQHYFCNTRSHAHFKDATKIVPRIVRLLSLYRTQFLPVIFTRYALRRTESPGAMGRWWSDVLYDDDDFSMIIDQLQPLLGEHVIRKTQYSAFFQTDLDTILRSLNVTNILITGVLTHLCCETTARDAFMRNYDVFLVTDATASDKKTFHNASLTNLSDGFATLVTTHEVLSWFTEIK